MDPIRSDPRFSKLGKDRKFLSVSKKHKKVKIDKRFQSMFSNDKFVSKCTVDKRGRPKSVSSKESYEKFYELEESSDEESDASKDNEEDEEDELNSITPNEEDPAIDSDIKSKLLSSEVDYARGEADLYSDSSSEEDSDSDEEEENQDEEDPEFFDKWGELDGEAERTEEATDRLAICNMDWDRVGADDIFLVLSSFCPAGGRVSSVMVYLSDFGKERLEEEKSLGPRELRQLRGEEEDEEEEEEVSGIVDKKESMKRAAAAMDRVRKYQVARLKYYYAVAKFDSIEAANHVYTECDGMEYELSATRLDLRFIPAEMTFSTPSSSCLAPPNPDKYQPKAFCTTALQQGKVELTWDEDNQDRAKAIKEAYNMAEGEEMDNLGDLIGSASEDEEEDGEEDMDRIKGDLQEKDSISKYRALLAGIGESTENPTEGDMEVTWNDEVSNEETEELTPWEKYLKKKKDKKKKKVDVAGDSGEDDVPEGVDMSDPFFAEELNERKQSLKVKKKKENKKKENTENDTNEVNDDKLALMVMDSDDEKDHFNYKDIVESETKSNKSKKKWKKKKKELEIPTEDSFNVDVTDTRFSALFSRPEFNIDPTDSNFKKTKNMEKIINEKQKRIGQTDVRFPQDVKKLKLDPDVSSSLKSVKNKWKKNAKKGKKLA